MFEVLGYGAVGFRVRDSGCRGFAYSRDLTLTPFMVVKDSRTNSST